MVARFVTGIVLLLCIAATTGAQTVDSTTAIDSVVRTDFIERLADSPNPDEAAAQQQLYLDDVEAARSRAVGRRSVELRTRLQFDPDLSNTDDYQRHYYRGSPIKTSTALTLRSSDLQLSLVEAKDPGEPLYFDHVVASLSLQRPIELGDLHLRRFVLGSYSLGYGSGLAFGSGHPQFPSAQTVRDPMPRSNGIAPYASTSSYRYFNGAAASLGIGRISLDLFYSDRLIDAIVDSNTITYIPQSGYHRTTTELDRRSDARQVTAGGAISYSMLDSDASGIQLGAIGYSMHYDREVMLSDTSSFKFGGDALSMVSAYAKARYSRISVDAEYSTSFAMGVSVSAMAITANVKLTDAVQLSANIHQLPPNFYSPFGGTFGLRSDNAQNERGCYLGASWDITSRLNCFAYSILAYNAPLPNASAPLEHTIESRIGGSYSAPSTIIGVQMRYASRSPVRHSISEYRLEITQKISSRFELHMLGRLRMVRDSVVSSAGYALGVEARYRPAPFFPVSLLVEPFQTDGFDSRVFSVEPDLSGTMPFVQLYGRGTRYKLVLGYDGLRWLHAEAAIGQTVFAYPSEASMQHHTYYGLQLTALL